MPPVLNAARVDVACTGNHDMDYDLKAHFRDKFEVVAIQRVVFRRVAPRVRIVRRLPVQVVHNRPRRHPHRIHGVHPVAMDPLPALKPPDGLLYVDFITVADCVSRSTFHAHAHAPDRRRVPRRGVEES